jgi:hypothetical protein
MDAICSYETSDDFQRSTFRYYPDDGNLHINPISSQPSLHYPKKIFVLKILFCAWAVYTMCEICGSHGRDYEAYYLLQWTACSLVYISCFNETSQRAVYYKNNIRYKNTNLATNLTKYQLNEYYIVMWWEFEHIKAYTPHFNFVSSSFQEVCNYKYYEQNFQPTFLVLKENKRRLMRSPCILCLLMPLPP